MQKEREDVVRKRLEIFFIKRERQTGKQKKSGRKIASFLCFLHFYRRQTIANAVLCGERSAPTTTFRIRLFWRGNSCQVSWRIHLGRERNSWGVRFKRTRMGEGEWTTEPSCWRRIQRPQLAFRTIWKRTLVKPIYLYVCIVCVCIY